MAAVVTRQTGNTLEVTLTVELTGSFLTMEEQTQAALNEAGCAILEKALARFDTDGSPIHMGDTTFKTKGRFGETYETIYGPIRVERHVYQNTRTGGKTVCPLEQNARMILNATPRYAKIVTAKYTHMGADVLKRDLQKSHCRSISRDYIKSLGDYVGAIAQAKEVTWEYDLPELEKPVASVAVGLDGTCMLLREDGYRQAMCGSISLYAADGERMHTIYTGAAPEYGKETFRTRFAREVERVQAAFPDALYVGVADGAPDNWEFLTPRTKRQILDFYHAREYVAEAAEAIHGYGPLKNEWEREWSHALKHEKGSAQRLLSAMQEKLPVQSNARDEEALRTAIRYFTNHGSKMEYWQHTAENLPIGSGVTEAACKVLIKERLAKSGMRWKGEGASAVIALRALEITAGRWEQFWQKVDRYGVN